MRHDEAAESSLASLPERFEEFLPGLPGDVRAHVFGLLSDEAQARLWRGVGERIQRERAAEPVERP